MPDTPLIQTATRWVLEKYPQNSRHMTNSLEWVDRIGSGSAEAVRIATLTHDMERAFPGPDHPVWNGDEDYDYYVAHSNRSARIVGEWLREQNCAGDFVGAVESLIRVHEFGGWPEADLVQAADSLSFLDVNVDLFLGYAKSGKFRVDQVRAKFIYSHDRIRLPELQVIAKPMMDRALDRLNAL
ncbi:MAG: hypothetical protein JWN34_2336 [Bryobacterales bacterium]|nr:hypothetical protein [Bryobacterales bacterium]